MSEVKIQVIYGHGCVCSRCRYAFEGKRVGDEIIVRHTPSWEPGLPWYLVDRFANCPLQAKRFRFPAMTPIELEPVQ